MHTYRACVFHARAARIEGDFASRDWWLNEAMLCRWAINGNPTWFTRDSIRDWNAAHAGVVAPTDHA